MSTKHSSSPGLMTSSVDGNQLRLGGELDLASAEQFASLVDATASAGGGPVVLDLADVTFLDSSALRQLVRLHQSHRLVISRPSPVVRRLFDITRLGETFTIVE